MKTFKRFYVWAMNAKLFMSIYFVAVVFLTGIIIAISGGQSIGLITLVQMLIVCGVIAVVQCALLDEKTDYSRGVFFARSCLWLVLATALILGSSLVFGWFSGMPEWCPYLLGAFMAVGLTASLYGLKFEQDADAVKLAVSLDRYKKRNAHGAK